MINYVYQKVLISFSFFPFRFINFFFFLSFFDNPPRPPDGVWIFAQTNHKLDSKHSFELNQKQ